MAGVKRSRDHYGSKPSGPKPKPKPKQEKPIEDGPFIPMFLTFRDELDDHHDRRERIIKASRDITALSKKMIFTLQRAGNDTPGPLPDSMVDELYGYESQIRELIKGVAPDLQGLNSWRYSRQITGGLQEYVEAISFRHYVVKGELITLEECKGYIEGTTELERPGAVDDKMDVDAEEGEKKEDDEEKEGKSIKKHSLDSPSNTAANNETQTTTTTAAEVPMDTATEPLQTISLTHGDFILGLFDLVGEIMRFAITRIARTPLNPHKTVPEFPLLTHLRLIRAGFESLDTARDPLGKDIDKKMKVMTECVEKVEVAMYGRVVRGSERPEGWIMTEDDTGWGGGGDYDD